MTMGRRVTILVTFSVAVAVLATSMAGYLMTRLSLYSQLDNQLTALARYMSTPISNGASDFGELNSGALQVSEVTVTLVRADGSVQNTPGAVVTVPTGPEELAVARTQQGTSARTITDSSGVPTRIVSVPLTINGDDYALVMGRSLDSTEATLHSLWLVLLAIGLLGILITAITGYLAARSATQPILDLSQAVKRVTRTDKLDPIPVRSSDELGQLATSFNTMLSSLASSRDRQRRLIADASHELRTPLTSMRTNVELLLADQKTGMLPETARGEILTDIAAQLGEFSSLIGDLVQLSRDDAMSRTPEPLELSEVVTKAVERAQRRGPGITFDVSLAPHPMMGDPATLERAVTNLLDNAVKFSPAEGTVTVQMVDDKVIVWDQGPGIAEEDLPHIFERFYRSDRSRNTPGTGLGLSIVAHTVTSHNGWIKASRAPGGGAMFTMSLPVVAPPKSEEHDTAEAE
ncbi:sensor histidine kinase [Acidipropionibacterium thoenii]|uniref:sensor histidine kinase n=1 Tax=Acidipropionibacterium thoenii TaxID=1751 RepID=UPI0006870578|nr:HAMP domain-containing sensor histidine kinase [Acidipropionibacterium thoenii]